MKKVLTILFLFCTYLSYSQAKIGADGSVHPVGAFPVAHTNEIKGSIKRVKSLVERNAIPVNMRDTGMLCWVTDSSKFYVLSGGTTNVRWVDLITTGTTVGVVNETDPIFSASPAATITDEKIAYWNLVGLMMRIDSARKEMHDTAVAHDKPIITYNPTDFILRNDSLFAVNGGEVDPVYMASIWSGLEDRPAIWDAKVDQSALDDTAAALRALYHQHDTIYFKHNGFSGFGEKLDPIVNLGFIDVVKLPDSVTLRFYRGDSTFKDVPLTIGNGTGSGVSRFSFVNANGISGTVATATTTPTLTLAIDTTKFATVNRLLDSLSHIRAEIGTSGGGGGGSGTVTNVSVVNANGVSGTVANPTTTPAITLAIDTTKFSTVNRLLDSLSRIKSSITTITNVVDSSHLDSLIKGNLIYGDTHQSITPKADNSNAYEAIDPVVEGAFVTNAVELADAKTRYTSQSTIFSTWRRFSHGVNTSGAGNPVPSNIIPGTPSETQSWAYNSGTNTINSTLNTASFTGLVSPDKYSNYTHTVTLTGHTGASFDDNDYIAVVIAYVEDASDMVTNNAFGLSSGSYPGINTTSATIPNQHTISLIRGRTSLTNFPFPVSFRYAIVYDLGKTDEQILVNGESSGVWNTDNAYGSGRNCDVRVIRSGDLITTATTDWDDAPGGKGSLRFPLTFDLSSNPLTQRFRGSASIGYGALSQENATWTNIVMNPNVNTVYDLRNGDKWVADNTGTYSLDATGSYYNDWGVRRILHNPVTQRTFYVRPDKTIDTIASKSIGTDTSSLSNRINTKEPIIAAGTTSQYWRGDKTWQTLPITDTTSLSSRIAANTTAIATKLNITDTANIRLRPIAGTNMTITGTYPNLTFASSGGSSTGTLQQVLTAGNKKGTVAIDTAEGTTWYWQPTNYGTSYTGASAGVADRFAQGWQSFTGVNGSGRPNVVGNFWGYNTTQGGGRINTSEASFRFGTETHWEMLGSHYFEFHLPEIYSAAGVGYRPWSMYISKDDPRVSFIQSQIGSLTLMSNTSNAGQYFTTGGNYSTGSWLSSFTAPNATSGIQFQGNGVNATTFIDAVPSGQTLQFRNFNSITLSPSMTYDASTNRFSKFEFVDSLKVNRAVNSNGLFFYNTTNLNASFQVDHGTGEVRHMAGAGGFYQTFVVNSGTVMTIANRPTGSQYTGVHIGLTGTFNDASALLQLDATDKGFLPPRMTKAQRDAIASPANGLVIYQTDNTPGIRFRENGAWTKPTTTADP